MCKPISGQVNVIFLIVGGMCSQMGAENILPLRDVVNDVIFLIVGGMFSQMGAENILPLRRFSVESIAGPFFWVVYDVI
jgi:hypothetical protein